MKRLFIILMLFCIGSAFGQSSIQSKNKAAQRIYDDASKNISFKLYDKAIEQLNESVKLDNQFTAAYQQLGDLYRRLQNYEAAKISYKKVLELNPEFYPATYFGLAESELNTGDYTSAIEHLKKYQTYPNLLESSKTLILKYLADCTFALQALKTPVKFNPVNLGEGVNTKEQEYLPVLTADEGTLIFTRMERQNEDFYKSVKQNGKWAGSTYLSKNINTTNFNEGAQFVSPDGLYLFFTGCNRPDGLGRCDIYLSRREGKDWSKPFNIGPPVNTSGWESQPSLSADGKTLYFVSTRPGGLGGYDIWKSELQPGGSWSNPVNLGPNVNTAYDEQSPFIHPDDQTLYFSSNGWPGLGNKDLFISRRDTTKTVNGKSAEWQKPENLGYPINTFKEETGLSITSDGHTAYFSSNKEGGFGGLDVYSFDLPEKIRPKQVTYVKGLVFDRKSNETLDAKVIITNVANGQMVYDDTSDPENGEFLVTMPAGKTYALTIEKDDYLFYSGNFSLDKPASANTPFNIRVPLDKIKIGAMVVLNNIFFDTNKYNLLPESKTELQQLIKFLKANPSVSIEIAGHTDNMGDDKLNQILSENRAKAVYNFLEANKILPSRLSYKGYGETTPVADNTSDEGRKNNRRTEFRIIKN